MRRKEVFFIIVYFLFYNVNVSCGGIWDLGPGDDKLEDNQEYSIRFGNTKLNSSLYQSIKRYYCSVDTFKHSYQILYGTNAWRFPVQDVNLTLSYPMTKGGQDYILTEMEVILYSDGTRSQGFVVSGGMFQDHIRMVYILPNITRLMYQFWLRGVPKTHFQGTAPFNNLCTSRS